MTQLTAFRWVSNTFHILTESLSVNSAFFYSYIGQNQWAVSIDLIAWVSLIFCSVVTWSIEIKNNNNKGLCVTFLFYSLAWIIQKLNWIQLNMFRREIDGNQEEKKWWQTKNKTKSNVNYNTTRANSFLVRDESSFLFIYNKQHESILKIIDIENRISLWSHILVRSMFAKCTICI